MLAHDGCIASTKRFPLAAMLDWYWYYDSIHDFDTATRIGDDVDAVNNVRGKVFKIPSIYD